MNQKKFNQVYRFRRISLISVIAVYFLILVGGIVRSTGSGMGCPDWPKCFGSWVPPTSENQLPNDYQDIYLAKRIEKNERFVVQLEKIGLKQKADEIRNDKSILIEEEFNATKTWIEYINRLIGAVIGVLVLLTFLRSIPLWGLDSGITVLSFINLILLLFQAWIGSIVVSTNLLPWMITFHMVLAVVIVGILLYVHHRSFRLIYPVVYQTDKPKLLIGILVLATILMLIQVVLGTQVREEIDRVAFAFGNMLRGEWISNLGITFLIHRSFSLLLLGIHVWFVYKVYQYAVSRSKIWKWSIFMILLIIIEIMSGVGMAYFAIPAFLQPIHLLLGTMILGVQFVILLQLKNQLNLQIENSIS